MIMTTTMMITILMVMMMPTLMKCIGFPFHGLLLPMYVLFNPTQ